MPGSSETPAKAYLKANPDKVIVVVRARECATTAVKLNGVTGVQGKRDSRAEPPVSLQIVVPHAVDHGAASGEVDHVARYPDAGCEIVNRIALERVYRVFRTGVAVKEVRVRRIDRRTGYEFERERPEGFRNTKLRLEEPAVGPEVDDAGRVVLARRHRDLQAAPDN